MFGILISFLIDVFVVKVRKYINLSGYSVKGVSYGGKVFKGWRLFKSLVDVEIRL